MVTISYFPAPFHHHQVIHIIIPKNKFLWICQLQYTVSGGVSRQRSLPPRLLLHQSHFLYQVLFWIPSIPLWLLPIKMESLLIESWLGTVSSRQYSSLVYSPPLSQADCCISLSQLKKWTIMWGWVCVQILYTVRLVLLPSFSVFISWGSSLWMKMKLKITNHLTLFFLIIDVKYWKIAHIQWCQSLS